MIIIMKYEDLKRPQGIYIVNKHNAFPHATAVKLNKAIWFLEIKRANQSRIKRLCVSKGSLYPSEDFFFLCGRAGLVGFQQDRFIQGRTGVCVPRRGTAQTCSPRQCGGGGGGAGGEERRAY